MPVAPARRCAPGPPGVVPRVRVIVWEEIQVKEHEIVSAAEVLRARGAGETFGLDEFYRRVAEVADLAGRPPDDYADLLGSGPIKP